MMSMFIIRASARFLAHRMADMCYQCMRPRQFCACGGAR